MQNLLLFSGSANPDLSAAIARGSGHRVSPSRIERFPDGELSVHVDEPVRGRHVFVVQSHMISSGGTIANAIDALLQAGARREIVVAATHGVLVESVRARLKHPALREIIVTDTIAPRQSDWLQLKVISIAPLLATVIQRLAAAEAISDLYQ